MKHRSRCRGFTLVEVVVATAVLSLLLLATVTALRTLGNTQAALERHTVRVDEVRSVSGFLRDLMESAVMGEDGGGLTLGGGSRSSTYFRLFEQGVEWKTSVLFGEAYGGTHIVRVAREADQLVMRWSEPGANGLPPETWEDTASRVLVREVEDYAVAVREEYDAEWSDRWLEERSAPALVRMQVKASGRFWPDLIMKVQR
jgi:general secretion pathway protein J